MADRKPMQIAKRVQLDRALRKLYYEDGLSMADIARRYHKSHGTIQRWFRIFDIKGRHPQEAAAILHRKKHPEPPKPAIVLEGYDTDGLPILRDPQSGDRIELVDRDGKELVMP